MSFTYIRRAAVALALIVTAGCTVKNTEPPPLNGPSGLALVLSLNAIPDSISQDGGSQSSIRVTAIGPDGKPVSAVPIRVDMMVNGVAQDFGTLSARSIVTNGEGVASVVYTAPPSPSNGIFGTCNSLPGTCVSIVATATATNFDTANPQQVQIRLVPPGVILPPAAVPTAAFTFSPTALSVGLPTQFDASTSLPGTGATQIVSYSWNFGDSTSGSGKNVTHTFSAGNSFVVTLTVTNDRGLAASVSQTLSVGTAALPTPSFTVSPSAPAAGESVFFNALASTAGPGHTIASYRWNFGDGTSGSGSNVSHAFAPAGTYVVQLTVTDEAGVSVTSGGTTVIVGVTPTPVANFTFSPAAPVVGQSVLFDHRTSTTVQGQAIVALDWNFGDGTAPVRCPGNTACAANGITTHVFKSAGTFNVALIITDAAGRTGIKSTSVTVTIVAATPPTANFTFSPAAPAPNQAVLFNAASSTPGTGHTLASYAWNFGDAATATGVAPSHPYSVAGTFTVTLTVTDEIGQSSVTSKTVTISTSAAPPPTAAFTFSPAAPGVGETVFFNASTSTPGAGHTITSYAWTFGDGATATGVTATHAYTATGTYSVQLKVTDEVGQSTTSAATTVTVGAPPTPTARFTFSPTTPSASQAVVFDASTSTPAGQGQPITEYAWSFGDGTPIVRTATKTIGHTFGFSGIFAVNLTVTDGAGRVGSTSANITVSADATLPIVIITATPSPATINAEVSFNAVVSSAGTNAGFITNYQWDFGDGSQQFSTSVSNVGYTYRVKGTFTVKVTATNNLGKQGAAVFTIVVQ